MLMIWRDPLVGKGHHPLDGKGPFPLDTGGTSIDFNVSTPLVRNEERLNIADLPGKLSVGCLSLTGCPVLVTELHESEAGISVTSVTGETQLATLAANSRPNIWHSKIPNILSEANSPGARESIERIETAYQYSPKVIDFELTALQTASQSKGMGRVPGVDSRCIKNE